MADAAVNLNISELSPLVRLGAADAAVPAPTERPDWTRAELSGRLCELSTMGASSTLTAAFHLVLDAQLDGEPVAWITTTRHTFFPPDVSAGGVDLEALIIVRAPGAPAAGRAADRLLRSGAFGLIVLDLGSSVNPGNPNHPGNPHSPHSPHGPHASHKGAVLPIPLQGRLVQLARAHETAVLCLTEKHPDQPSLGSLVSLRGQPRRRRLGPDRFACGVTIIKDKRHGPGWQCNEVYRGPDGLC